MAVLRCTHCRIIVDVATPASAPIARCAACGGPLERGAVPSTIWDDDDPTQRRPVEYARQLARPRG